MGTLLSALADQPKRPFRTISKVSTGAAVGLVDILTPCTSCKPLACHLPWSRSAQFSTVQLSSVLLESRSGSFGVVRLNSTWLLTRLLTLGVCKESREVQGVRMQRSLVSIAENGDGYE
jgi:hypothetical protein